jgi:hypothetical protein
MATLRDHFTKSSARTDCFFSRSTKLPLKLSNKTMTAEGARAHAQCGYRCAFGRRQYLGAELEISQNHDPVPHHR